MVNWPQLQEYGITPTVPITYETLTGDETYEIVLGDILASVEEVPGDASFAVLAAAVVIADPVDLEYLQKDRLKVVTRPAPTSPDDLAIYHKLRQSIGTVRFDDFPIGDVLLYIEETAGTPMVVDWRDLATWEVAPDTWVTLSAKGLTVDECLWHLLWQQAMVGKLSYDIQNGAIYVGTRDVLYAIGAAATDEERAAEYLDIPEEADLPGRLDDIDPPDGVFDPDDDGNDGFLED